jgi:hypothetical protein
MTGTGLAVSACLPVNALRHCHQDTGEYTAGRDQPCARHFHVASKFVWMVAEV